MSQGVRWLAGEPALRAALPTQLSLDTESSLQVVRENPRRRILRLDRCDGAPLCLKHFRTATGRHALRERLKAWGGRSPARREWRNLAALHAAGAPVPEPLALGVLADGDWVLVTQWVDGPPLGAGLPASHRARRELLRSLGRSVARLHRAGFAHGDLHAGNILVAGTEVVIVDLQSAIRRASARARRRDLGHLDYSLWSRSSVTDRLRIRHAALGIRGRPDAESRRKLRGVGDAARQRADAHARSRTRRSLRPGRLYARIRCGELAGMRHREIEEAELQEAVKAHRMAQAQASEGALKADSRSAVSRVAVGHHRLLVKDFPSRGVLRALADGLRGSPARRAWLGGHGLRARGIGSATPFAFLEQRHWGIPRRSVVVLADLGRCPDALEVVQRDPAEGLDLLVQLLVQLHGRAAEHGDLKATHVLIAPQPLGTCLVDLEGVRFPRRLSEARRLRSLAELNASLPDSFPARLRRRAFERYARHHPFRMGTEDALRRLVAASLARRHRFRGEGCAEASAANPATKRQPGRRDA